MELSEANPSGHIPRTEKEEPLSFEFWKRCSVLVVDDEDGMRNFLQRALESRCGLVRNVSSAEEGMTLLERSHFDLIILDIALPGKSGIEWLYDLRRAGFMGDVVLITAFADMDTAISALRAGASDFILKPFRVDQILNAIDRCFERTRLARENFVLRREVAELAVDGIVGNSPAIRNLCAMVKRIAPMPSTVLIQGESGTGKEIMARYIHSKSDRAQGPFIAVNCASLPEGLLESELFGHEKGAFTGAVMRKLGKFELAQNGTLLLDEISEMHLHLQAKLLRVLQENEIDRVGGRHPVPINVRVIATTNQKLQDAIQNSRFREDLFYRLNVIAFNLPALRARRSDIALLAEYFLRRYAKLFNKGAVKFSSQALAALENASWPGNVRELENAVARGVLLAQGHQIQPRDILADAQVETPAATTAAPIKLDKPVTLREMEQSLIFQALDETAGNRTHAAKLLGISVRTLRNKLHEYRAEPFPRSSHSSQVA